MKSPSPPPMPTRSRMLEEPDNLSEDLRVMGERQDEGCCSSSNMSETKQHEEELEDRMQVEVSKYTEGSKDTMVRPNGLPESLICYDARQKDKARSSLSELVMVVKHPRALSESTNLPHMRKSEGGGEMMRFEATRRRNSENANPVRRNSCSGMRSSMQ